MSIRLMSSVFLLDVPPTEKLLLLAMADFAADDGSRCYPAVGTLAVKTSQSRRGVQKIMRRLEEKGLIAPIRVSKGRTACEYQINLPQPTANPVQGSTANPVRSNCERGSSTANQSASNREPGSPNPLRTVTTTVSEPKKAADAAAVAFSSPLFVVNTAQDAKLADCYPWVQRQQEYRKMALWLEANRPDRKVKNTLAFVQNWFNKIACPSNGGTTNGSGATIPSRDQQRHERSQQAIENVLGHRSRLADRLREGISGGTQRRVGLALPIRP